MRAALRERVGARAVEAGLRVWPREALDVELLARCSIAHLAWVQAEVHGDEFAGVFLRHGMSALGAQRLERADLARDRAVAFDAYVRSRRVPVGRGGVGGTR